MTHFFCNVSIEYSQGDISQISGTLRDDGDMRSGWCCMYLSPVGLPQVIPNYFNQHLY
jgi:hypothetical protein